MKILICPDKFKECLPAGKVATHIQRGINKVIPGVEYKIIPLADGGEGTVEALVNAFNGHLEQVRVRDPLMRPVDSFFGISGDGKTAFIEMAAASGLALLSPEERNPLITTTYGTGELIGYAMDRGCRKIILGIGGSATLDGGVGMAQALGVHFTNTDGNEIGRGGSNLGMIYHIDLSEIDQRIVQCEILTACDVVNKLTGPEGAVYTYGPQKGAKPAALRQLDDNLRHLSRVIFDELHMDVESIPGAGAAGGMGAGIMAFLGGAIRQGFDLISHTVKLEKAIEWADLVITGEGRLDTQTAFGKTPAGVASLAMKKNRPVIAFTGAIEDNAEKFQQLGFNAVIPIDDGPMTLEESMVNAGRLLENAGERVARVLMLGMNFSPHPDIPIS